MCILRISDYTCGYTAVRSIIPCEMPGCPSVLSVGTLHPDYYIHIDSQHWGNMAYPCRSCRADALWRADPINFRSTREFRGLALEGQMAFRYQVQELEMEHRRPIQDQLNELEAEGEYREATFCRRAHIEHVAVAASLHTICTADLEADNRSCPVCLEAFSDQTEEQTGHEQPVRLNCDPNHVIGRLCLVRMLDERLTTCPFCRSRIDASVMDTGSG